MKHILQKIKKFYFSTAQKYYARKNSFWNGTSDVHFSSMEKSNSLLTAAIDSGNPLMVARHGSTELSFVNKPTPPMFRQLCTWSGFFPVDPALGPLFCERYLEDSTLIDILAIWNYRHGKGFPIEEKIFRDQSPSARIIDLSSLNPFLFENPWSSALAGKRILVIHPFKNSIEKQYTRREVLFKNKEILPSFHLTCIQAVQSLGGMCLDHKSWFEALESMKHQMEDINFDIALISCGAYGLPLAAHAKRLGKQGLHIGGGLQLLFGIKGKRWEHPSYGYDEKFYNEYWIRPSEEETPKAAPMVENSCYW